LGKPSHDWRHIVAEQLQKRCKQTVQFFDGAREHQQVAPWPPDFVKMRKSLEADSFSPISLTDKTNFDAEMVPDSILILPRTVDAVFGGF
jgi:hypothetical protein